MYNSFENKNLFAKKYCNNSCASLLMFCKLQACNFFLNCFRCKFLSKFWRITFPLSSEMPKEFTTKWRKNTSTRIRSDYIHFKCSHLILTLYYYITYILSHHQYRVWNHCYRRIIFPLRLLILIFSYNLRSTNYNNFSNSNFRIPIFF